MIKSSRLTPLAIERTAARLSDVWLSDDEGTRGGGRLVVRISPNGSRLFYFRYSIDGSRKQLPIGPYSRDEIDGRFTLEQARRVARSYSALHRAAATRDVAAHLKRIDADAEAARAATQLEAQRTAEESERLARYSVKSLCEWYVTYLKTAKRQSASGVESLFRCHVYNSEFAALPAGALTPKQAATLLRRLVDQNKGRTAAKVRSALHAAYALALKAETDATAPAELIPFGVSVNPIASTAALSRFNVPRTRVLTAGELRELLRRLFAPQDPVPLQVRALRLVLLLGGQRALQLLRVETTDINLDEQTITLRDPKGRRQQARAHLLPLNKRALKEVLFLLERAKALESTKLFASRKGILDSGGLSTWVRDCSRDLVKAKASTHNFQFSDLRRTAETTLAALGISKDLRAQIQSHGLSGIQARHYDKYEYLEEKRTVLKAWEAHLKSTEEGTPAPSIVRRIKRAA